MTISATRSLARLLAIAAAATLAGCGGGPSDGDDDPGGVDAAADGATVDAPAADEPSTDPDNPAVLALGQTFSATAPPGVEHFFVFTAPQAGTYRTTYAGPVDSMTVHCAATGGCLCGLDAFPNCCFVQEGQTGCTYVITNDQDGPLEAGQAIYPSVYMYPGVSGPYTITITGPE